MKLMRGTIIGKSGVLAQVSGTLCTQTCMSLERMFDLWDETEETMLQLTEVVQDDVSRIQHEIHQYTWYTYVYNIHEEIV